MSVCVSVPPVQMPWECMMGNRLQSRNGFQPAGLECGCHASKCIKISEQSAKY